jgi:hypothetical protein
MSTQVGHDPGNFYVWRASDGFAIHLSLNMVTQLTAQIARSGGKNQPYETRGILLGRSIDTPFRSTVIDDFKLIPASADEANADSDDALFEIACRMAEAGNEQRALGFFRAHRDGNLNLGPRDLQTFSRLFCETGKIALLIQTSKASNESDAALFYWKQGGVHPRDFGFGFPLDAGQLAKGHPGWRYANPLDHTPAAATAAPPKPAVPKLMPMPMPPPPVSISHERIRWSRLMPTAALVVISVGALQLATRSTRTTAGPGPTELPGSEIATSASAGSATAPAAAEPGNDKGLGLTVTTRQHQLEIRWDRESPVIAMSDRAVMQITEDGITEAVPFDQSQLRDGYVAYTPKTTDVNIRLEVTGKNGGTQSESIRSVAIP